MDNKKRIDLLRKKNAELTNELNELKTKINNDNSESNYYAKELIKEIEDIRIQWEQCLNEINEYRDKYSELIKVLKESKFVMQSMGFKLPWYKKMILKINKSLHNK